MKINIGSKEVEVKDTKEATKLIFKRIAEIREANGYTKYGVKKVN